MKIVSPSDFRYEQLDLDTVLAYPCEQLYGLGCNPTYTSALKNILKLKGRKPEQGFVILTLHRDYLNSYVDWETSLQKSSPTFSQLLEALESRDSVKQKDFITTLEKDAQALVESLSSSEESLNKAKLNKEEVKNTLFYALLALVMHNTPLTLVLEKSKTCPELLSGQFPSLAVRFPQDVALLELLEEAGNFLVSTSANLHGQPSLKNSRDIIETFKGKEGEDKLLVIEGELPADGQSSIIVNPLTLEVLRGQELLVSNSANPSLAKKLQAYLSELNTL